MANCSGAMSPGSFGHRRCENIGVRKRCWIVLANLWCFNPRRLPAMGTGRGSPRNRALERTSCRTRERFGDGGLPGGNTSISRWCHPRQASLAARPVRRVRPGVRPWGAHNGSSHGQGLKEIHRHRWLGIWPLCERQARGRGAAPDVLRLPRGQCQGTRLRLYPIRAIDERESAAELSVFRKLLSPVSIFPR
jgi:hypothetical protein